MCNTNKCDIFIEPERNSQIAFQVFSASFNTSQNPVQFQLVSVNVGNAYNTTANCLKRLKAAVITGFILIQPLTNTVKPIT